MPTLPPTTMVCRLGTYPGRAMLKTAMCRAAKGGPMFLKKRYQRFLSMPP